MAIKPDAQKLTIVEQIIEDSVSGLTFQFEARPDGEFAIYIYGDLPLGNRTLNFSRNGEFEGAGIHLKECPRPTWIRAVD